MVNIHDPKNSRKSTQLQTKGWNAAPFLRFAESLPSQVRAIYCIYCWRAEFYTSPSLYCICQLTLWTCRIFMIIQSFCIPGGAFINIKEVNRLVREAFVCVCGNNVFEWVWTHLAMLACMPSFVLCFSAFVRIHSMSFAFCIWRIIMFQLMCIYRTVVY